MLRAIRDLESASGGLTAPLTPAATEPARQDDAERRQLTVMFTDLVGSTALSTRLDPEDLRSVICAYHKCVAERVTRFDGFVARYKGDGVLIYFGYPQAHEDDAERAVRAGMALVESLQVDDVKFGLEANGQARILMVQFQNMRGNGLDQFRDVATPGVRVARALCCLP